MSINRNSKQLLISSLAFKFHHKVVKHQLTLIMDAFCDARGVARVCRQNCSLDLKEARVDWVTRERPTPSPLKGGT